MITKTFEFVSDFATTLITIQGEDDWTEEMWDSVALDELSDVVKQSSAFYLNEVYPDG
jgi:hypothetical protein